MRRVIRANGTQWAIWEGQRGRRDLVGRLRHFRWWSLRDWMGLSGYDPRFDNWYVNAWDPHGDDRQ